MFLTTFSYKISNISMKSVIFYRNNNKNQFYFLIYLVYYLHINLWIFKIVMKKYLFLIYFSLIFCSMLFSDFLNYTNDTKISIEDCIKLSILNSRKLKISEEDLVSIEYKTKEALSYRFPKLDFIMNYGKFNTTYDMVLGTYENVLMLDNKNNELFSNKLLFTQILYRGNFAKNIKKTSKINIKKTKAEYEVIKTNVIFNIKILFQEYLFLSKKVNFYKKYFEYLENFKKYYLKDKNVDLYKKNEFNLYLFNIKQTLDKIDLDKKLKKLEIFKQTGIDLNSDLEIEGTFEKINYQEKRLNEYIAKALFIRPELLLSEAEEELNFIETKITMNEKNPFITVNGVYDYYSTTYKDNFFTSANKNWFLGIGLNWPIIDSGYIVAKHNQEKSNLKKIKLKKTEIEENIKLEIAESYENFILYKNILENTEKFYKNYQNNKEFENFFSFFNLNNIDNNKIKYLSYKDFELIKFYSEIFINYMTSIFDYNKSVLVLQKESGDIV